MNATKPPSFTQTGFRQSLTEDEKEALKAFVGALEPFRNLRSTMPMQYVITYLLVALDEGEGTTEYARRAGVSTSVMSRHLLDIGPRNRSKALGFDLIHQRQDPMNLSRHQQMLTQKGQQVAHQIVRSLSRKK